MWEGRVCRRKIMGGEKVDVGGDGVETKNLWEGRRSVWEGMD